MSGVKNIIQAGSKGKQVLTNEQLKAKRSANLAKKK